MELSQILGWTATILFSIMIVPQMIKTIRTKDTEGVSLFLFIIFLTANVVALVYAILINQFPLMFKYSLAIMTTLFYITIYAVYSRRFRKRKHKNN